MTEAAASELLAELTKRRDVPGLLRMATHLGAIGVSGWLIHFGQGGYWVIPAMVLHGALLSFLFAPLHESVHGTAFASPALNRLTGWICGLVLLLTPGYFSAFHFAHHRHTQDPELDPELATPKPRGWGEYLWILSGAEYWRRMVTGIVGRAIRGSGDRFITKGRAEAVKLEARVYAGILGAMVAVSIWWESEFLVIYWVFPALLGQPFLRIFLLSEHWGCPTEGSLWDRTRSTVSHPVVRWFAWNMPFHAEHHAHPTVPFHALPEVGRRLADQRRVVSPGYIPFHGKEVPGLIRAGTGH